MSFISLKRSILVVLAMIMVAVGASAQQPELVSADLQLEQMLKNDLLNGVVAGAYTGGAVAADILKQVDNAMLNLKKHAVLLSQLANSDNRRKNSEAVSLLLKTLASIKSGLLHDGVASTIQAVQQLHSDVDVMLNSTLVEMAIEVSRFSTKFVVAKSGNSLGKRAIVGIIGKVFYDSLNENLTSMARFQKFMQAGSAKMTVAIDMQPNDAKLVELEKLPDVYGHPSRPVIVHATVRLYHVITPKDNVIAPLMIRINKISYR